MADGVGAGSADAKKERARLKKQRQREQKKGVTLPCDLCESTEGPELHCVRSLPKESYDFLCQITGVALSLSTHVCCRHFEDHSGRISKNNPLVVRKEFAGLQFVSPSLRRKPTVRSEVPRRPRKPTVRELEAKCFRFEANINQLSNEVDKK
jgi:hypothetical protein